MRTSLPRLGSLALAGWTAFGACRPTASHAPATRTTKITTCETGETPAAQPAAMPPAAKDAWVRAHYDKQEVRIPMRDGVELFTAIYAPKDRSQAWPILLNRTPYSVAPYGPDAYRESLGPSELLLHDNYVFVYQDVRGRFMSQGTFTNMTPHRGTKQGPSDVDESSDTWDTVEWLVKHVPNNNGKVGQWGISYPGFYAAAGMIDHHPALVAVSPQAPIADWWFDDFYHHGAFFLPHFFNFFHGFGRPRPQPTTERPAKLEHGTPDGYDFFLRLGSLRNVDAKWYGGEVAFWHDVLAHPSYDDFWKPRNLLPHLKNVAPAVMTVGGWFDAEDLYGPLQIYRAIEAANPGIFNMLVMGPWRHGGWARSEGDHLGNVHFGSKTAEHYREHVEKRFFEHFLKGAKAPELPEAYVFETGAGRWREFAAWPPPGARRELVVDDGGRLAFDAKPTGAPWDSFVSDPRRPVPSSEDVSTAMTPEYMTDDQRYTARRPDVLVWQTEPLAEDVTLGGPISAELWVSTSRQDADWVVKLVDVHPGDAPDHAALRRGQHMGNYHMLVRSEVFRGRFRQGYDRPRPFAPNKPEQVTVPLQDVLHTFRKGHRIQVQVHSTWFPLVARNPQKWVDNPLLAEDKDFVSATHRVWHDARHPTRLVVTTLPSAP